MDEGEAQVQTIRDRCSPVSRISLASTSHLVIALPLRAPSVWANNHTIPHAQILPNPPQRTRLSIKVINRHIEEPLNLARVEIHRDHMVTPRRLQHVGHEFGGDRSPTLILLVLTSVWEVGQDGGDAAGGGCAAGVDEDEELHDVIVDVAGFGRLDYEDCGTLVRHTVGGVLEGCGVPSSSRTDSPMEMLLSLFEYCKTMIFASSMPSLCAVSVHLHLCSRAFSIAFIPVRDQLSQGAMTVASQQLDRVGRHGRATVWEVCREEEERCWFSWFTTIQRQDFCEASEAVVTPGFGFFQTANQIW